MGGTAAHAQKKNPTIVGFKSHHHEESSYTHHRHNRSHAKITAANKKPHFTSFAACASELALSSRFTMYGFHRVRFLS